MNWILLVVSVAQCIAALMIASNSRGTWWGFLLGAIASTIGAFVAPTEMVIMFVVFLGINFVGLHRYWEVER